MKLYIWEGHGISSAYHDDGTLVVLAESPEEAREVVLQAALKMHSQKLDETGTRTWSYEGDLPFDLETAVGYRWGKRADGPAPIDREPDRVVDLDTPVVVAFNGGGYD